MRGRRPSPRRWLPVLAIGCLLLAALAFGVGDTLSLAGLAERREQLQSFAARQPLLSAALFALAYVAAVLVVLPGAGVLTIFGGFLFGWAAGGALSALASTLGAALLFTLARWSFGPAPDGRAGGRLERFRDGFARDAFGYMLVLRLTPIVPFTVLNVAPAFLGVGLRPYVLATLLGVAPASFVFAFLGSGLDAALARARGGETLGLSDIVTPEIRLALLGLAALALLGLLLKRRLMRAAPVAPRLEADRGA